VQRWNHSTHLPNVLHGGKWVRVPDLHITVVHGLNDGDPAMTMAICKFAALDQN
jgi:hypothetical protein